MYVTFMVDLNIFHLVRSNGMDCWEPCVCRRVQVGRVMLGTLCL